jgi:hypothetical protein
MLDGGFEKELCHVLRMRTFYTSSAGTVDDILSVVAERTEIETYYL